MRRAGAAVLLTLAACTSAPPPAPPESRMVSPEALKPLTNAYRDYVAAMVKLGSNLPGEQAEGLARLEALNYQFFEDDRVLIRKAVAGDDAARQELARRGQCLDALFVFWTRAKLSKWNEAREKIVALGQDAKILLVTTLLRMLINGQFLEDWIAIRYQLVRIGDDAFETAWGLLQKKAEETPDTPIFKQDDLIQLTILVLEFKEKGKGPLGELTKSPKFNVRKVVARAIGEAQATEYADIVLEMMAKDPHWEVRAAAAQAAGRLRGARDRIGKLLVARLAAERDRMVRWTLVSAMGDLAWEDAVPTLVQALDVPDQDLQDRAVTALVQITGERLGTPAAWRKWYAKDYAAWRAKLRKP